MIKPSNKSEKSEIIASKLKIAAMWVNILVELVDNIIFGIAEGRSHFISGFFQFIFPPSYK